MQPLGRNVKAPAPARRDRTHMQSDENAMLKLGLHVCTLVRPWKCPPKKKDGYVRMCVHLQLRGLATTSSATQEVSMIFWPTWLTKRHPLSCSWIALDKPPWAQPCPHNQGHLWVLKAVFRWNIFPQSLRGTFKHFDVHPYLARRLPEWLILFRWVETTKWTKLHVHSNLHLKFSWTREPVFGKNPRSGKSSCRGVEQFLRWESWAFFHQWCFTPHRPLRPFCCGGQHPLIAEIRLCFVRLPEWELMVLNGCFLASEPKKGVSRNSRGISGFLV